MYTKEFIKDVAIAFNIKCNKYANLSPDMRNVLFNEAYEEISTIYLVNGRTVVNDALKQIAE